MNSAKKRATILLVLGAVIGAVVVGVYFLQDNTAPPTTDTPPTATSIPSIFDMEPIIPEAKVSIEGWKTCRNEEYGYEFQFPGEWHVYGEDALGDPIGGKRAFVRESGECNGAAVLVTNGDVYATTALLDGSSMSIVMHTDSRENEQKNSMRNVLIVIDGVRSEFSISKKSIHNNKESWGFQAIKNNHLYVVRGGSYEDDMLTIETIFSTWKFIDTVTTSSSE